MYPACGNFINLTKGDTYVTVFTVPNINKYFRNTSFTFTEDIW